MAKAKEIKVCPKCSNAVPEMKSQVCPFCGYQKVPYTDDPFGTPDYGYSQYREAFDKLGEERKPETLEELQKLLTLKFYRFTANMRPNDKIDGMRDALVIIQTALLSTTPTETLHDIVEIGIRIGMAATAASGFIKAGGKTHGISESSRPEPRNPDPDEPGGDGDLRP